MVRSNLQPGPETNHYHDTLGIDQTIPGTAQMISLLGPYAYVRGVGDDHSSHDTGIVIPAGSLCIKAFAVFVADSIGGGDPNDALYIKAGDTVALNIYNLNTGYPNTSYAGGRVEPGNDLEAYEQGRSFFALQDVDITVTGQGPVWHGGEIDIYALIAAPS